MPRTIPPKFAFATLLLLGGCAAEPTATAVAVTYVAPVVTIERPIVAVARPAGRDPGSIAGRRWTVPEIERLPRASEWPAP